MQKNQANKKSQLKKIISAAIVLIILIITGISSGKITSIEDAINYIKTHLTPQNPSGRKSANCNPYENDCSKYYAQSSTSFLNGNNQLKQIAQISKNDYLAILKKITIKEPKKDVNYSRSEWKHWIGSPCDTRKTVLKEQGIDVVTGARCVVQSGFWIDPYTLEEYAEPKLDIDHVIPLGYAAKNGADKWNTNKKQQFANDFGHLLAVSLAENRSKGDAGPKDYMPPKNRCLYSKIWVHTLNKYNLNISKDDKLELEKNLKKCKN